MDMLLFLGLAALVCVGVFLNGWRFARMTANPFKRMKLFGMPMQGSELTVEQLNRLGRMQMLAAPVIFLFFALVTSGLLGPINGDQPGWFTAGWN